MLPPPVPIDVTSTTGMARAWRSIIGLDENITSPSITRPTSKLVPPTSVVMTWLWPSWRPTMAAAATPPTGPECRVWTGMARAMAAGRTPPPIRITTKRPPKPLWRNPSSSRAR